MRLSATTTTVLIFTTASLLLAGCATTGSAKSTSVQQAPVTKTVAVAKVLTAKEITMTDILDNPKKMAVLEKYAPSLAANPQLSMARGMTLADVAAYAEAGLSESMVKDIVTDISKL